MGNVSPVKIVRWLTSQELRDIADGEVPGMGKIDLEAASEGQAFTKIRNYAKKPKWWQLEG